MKQWLKSAKIRVAGKGKSRSSKRSGIGMLFTPFSAEKPAACAPEKSDEQKTKESKTGETNANFAFSLTPFAQTQIWKTYTKIAQEDVPGKENAAEVAKRCFLRNMFDCDSVFHINNLLLQAATEDERWLKLQNIVLDSFYGNHRP